MKRKNDQTNEASLQTEAGSYGKERNRLNLAHYRNGHKNPRERQQKSFGTTTCCSPVLSAALGLGRTPCTATKPYPEVICTAPKP